MIKNPCKFIYLIAALFAAGCASSGIAITGKQFPRIKAVDVVIVETVPDNAVSVGIISVIADGWTLNGAQVRAFERLKDKAAAAGANRVLLTTTFANPWDGYHIEAKAFSVP